MTDKIALTKIQPAPFQPRKEFDPVKLQELADSMREKGLIEAIVIRPHDGGYQLIAGERRFRAAKILGWKDIRAEIQEMGDLEAMEMSLVENIQREDLDDKDLEDFVTKLWEVGGPNTGSGKYKDYRDLSRALGQGTSFAGYYLRGKSDRVSLGFEGRTSSPKEISTIDLAHTSTIDDRVARKTLLEKKADGEIAAKDLHDYAKAVRDSPKVVKEAILEKPKQFTPKVAEGISKLPEESQAGTIATIKKGQMGEEEAIQITKTVKDSPKVVKEAVLEKPKVFTSKVAEEISKIPSEEAQKSTIDAIKKSRLNEEEAVQLAKWMDHQAAFTKEHEMELKERDQKFASLLKQLEAERKRFHPSPGSIRVGQAFQNIVHHMGLVHEIGHDKYCTCPHCGKEASKYLRWTCCDEGRNETLNEAFEYARQKWREYVNEERERKQRGESQ